MWFQHFKLISWDLLGVFISALVLSWAFIHGFWDIISIFLFSIEDCHGYSLTSILESEWNSKYGYKDK